MLERMHVGMDPFDYYVDAHLSGFSVKEHGEWFDLVVNNLGLLMGNRDKYRTYTKAWRHRYGVEYDTVQEDVAR